MMYRSTAWHSTVCDTRWPPEGALSTSYSNPSLCAPTVSRHPTPYDSTAPSSLSFLSYLIVLYCPQIDQKPFYTLAMRLEVLWDIVVLVLLRFYDVYHSETEFN